MTNAKNIDELFSRLTHGSLAALLVSAVRGAETPEARAQALRAVLQKRLEELHSKDANDGKIQSA